MIIGFIIALLKTLSLNFSDWIGQRKLKLVAFGVSFFAQIFAWIFVSVEVDPDHWLECHEVYVLSILVLLSVARNSIISGSDGWLSETFLEKIANWVLYGVPM
ncbi:hypothetical protein L1049_002339 [Liquidambar formosana]|uniref:Uncharacterized protein n=1 Tax=Liquidambar formosana TaxID=63359 RepID=A0AAP0NH54_LIQFO